MGLRLRENPHFVNIKTFSALPPEVLVGTLVSPGGLVAAGEEIRLFCAIVVLRSSPSLFFFLQSAFTWPIVSVETLLVLVGIRLGISLFFF